MKEILIEGWRSSDIHPFADLPLRPFWVFLSGKEMPDRKRLLAPTAIHYLLVSLLWLTAGVSGVCWALNGGWYTIPLYVGSMVLIVGGTRYMVATNIHMMAHNLMFSSPATNRWWGEILTTVFLIQSHARYRADHLKHHGIVFGTLKDGDGLSVVKLGFTPEKTRLQLWLKLATLCVSPAFHLNFAMGRMRENLVFCSHYRKAMTVGWLSILGLIGYQVGLSVLIHTYFLPVILLSQVASLMQLLTEHVWISTDHSCRDRHHLLTNGRYCGVPLPVHEGSNMQYGVKLAVWSLRIVFVELPARITVLQGSLPEHDWHHRHPGSRQWYNGSTLRELEIESDLKKQGQTDYLEAWGSFEILDRVFFSISKSEPYPELNDLLLAGKLDYGDIK